MSGFAAILNLDAEPIDAAILARMSAAMAQRGPDGAYSWSAGPVGLTHVDLHIPSHRSHCRQPATLDGRVWITGDVRIDGRQELIRQLAAAGCQASPEADDSALVLHAYQAWQEKCAGNLLGDFAFSIWDEERRRLFCACDHFGVKPLYYTRTPSALIVANSFPAILTHPAVSSDHSELAIADFLLFGRPQDPENTVYDSIKCLPAGHTLSCTSAGRVSTRRYWSLPLDGRIRFRRAGEYVERFSELLSMAVDDRLPRGGAAVMMSGGLDSTSIAAVAHECSSRRPEPSRISAHTMMYRTATGAEESRLARIAADAIGIPNHVFDGSEFHPFANWQSPDWLQPEPTDLTFAEANRQFMLAVKQTGTRVVLTGHGGDPVFATTKDLFWNLLRGFQARQAASYIGRHFHNYRRLPPLILRSRLLGRVTPKKPAPLPDCIDPDLARRWELADRWRRAQESPPAEHPLRPEAFAGLDPAFWQWVFRRSDAALADLAIEARHPLFDVRLVEFLLAIPPSPWFLEKSILREAMQGKLPEEIRRRPKRPAGQHPIATCQRSGQPPLLPESAFPDEITAYVSPQALRAMAAGPLNCKDGGVGVRLRCLSLAVWLHHAGRTFAERKALHGASR